jgi:hypothetical protein
VKTIAPVPILDALRAAVGFDADGDPAGNLTVGRGHLKGSDVRVAMVENRSASGSLGSLECDRLAGHIRSAVADRASLVLFLDSAGAKVSEGLRALGAFRTLYRAGLEAALLGTPIAAVLGRNCFGGASMLAHLGGHRIFSANTQLAMSGPSIIASAAGMDPLDEMFRAMADAAISAGARAKASTRNAVWTASDDLGQWLAEALKPAADVASDLRVRHDSLAVRLGKSPPVPPTDALRRRDLEKIYALGYEAREDQGFIAGKGLLEEGEESFIGIVGKSVLGAARAWRLSEAAWELAAAPPRRLAVFLDCATHSARLDDERIVLSEYIADMGYALAALAARGTRVRLVVLGSAGGGVYVALAAPAVEVASAYGADIHVLPRAAVAAILGESEEAAPSFDLYRAAGVAEREIKLGILPGKK